MKSESKKFFVVWKDSSGKTWWYRGSSHFTDKFNLAKEYKLKNHASCAITNFLYEEKYITSFKKYEPYSIERPFGIITNDNPLQIVEAKITYEF